MGAAVCAVSITAGIDPYLSLLLAFAAGMAAGLCTGLLHTLLKIPPLLSGILTMIAAWSVNLRIMGKANVSLLKLSTVFTPVMEAFGMTKTVATIVVGAGVTLVLICFCYWFFGTEVGCAIRATGGNPNMARAQGINTNADKVLGLMLSNGLVAFSGALLTQYQGFVDVGMGRGAIVIGLAAVIIGEVVFSKIFHNFALKLLAVVIGAILYYIVIQVVLWLGLNTNDLKMLQALVVAMFLAVPYWKHRYVKKKGDANHG